MKKMIFLSVFLYSIAFSVNVTFHVNSSTVDGVVDSTSGVDLRGTVTQWGAGSNMVSDGGDYWSLTVALEPGDYQYKYGAQIKNEDGTISDYWENDIPGANYVGDNRTLTVGFSDMVVDLDYLGSGPDGAGSYTPTDSVDILMRVNMSENPDFDPANNTLSMVGHFPNAGQSNMWSPGTHQLTRESATSDYWSIHLKLAQGYVDTIYDDQVADVGNPLGLHMYRFVVGDSWGGSENLNGEYVTGNENRIFMVDAGLADTTVQWVYWNNKGPEPFSPSGTLSSYTFSTSVANAIAGNGFTLGDTLLVKYGYGGTQSSAMEDTLVNSIGNIYSVAISNFPYNADLGLYYQYYRVKNGVQYRETYFNFAYTGDEQPLAERRFTSFSGVTDGGTASVTDNVPSTVDERRQPTFRNTDPLGQAMTVTYTVDVRPAYYQIMSGDTLNDIQGTLNISDASEIFTRGVSMNGPATGDWVAWGATLDGTAANKMHDDGTNGDAVAGDSIFTVQFAYEATATIGQEFKFGIDGGDNESGYGLNHIENIDVTAPTVASYWGSINPFKYDAWDYDNNTPNISLTDPVNVTFKVNSSTVEGIVDTTSGVDLRGTVTQWGAGSNMVSDGGDYWSLTVALEPGDYQYKYGAQIKNEDGTISDYWENDIPGANYVGDNRTLTVGFSDMVVDLDYLGSGPDGAGSYTPTDSVDILMRVNMSENPDFDPANNTLSMVGHFPNAGQSNMWSPGTHQLTRESATSDYWSIHLKLAQGYVDTIYDDQVADVGNPLGLHMYRFVVGDSWGGSENLNGEYVTGNENRIFMVDAGLADTTVQWVYWNNKGPEPFSPSGTLSSYTFSTSVANAIAGNGFTLGDTLLVKYGYGGTQSSAMEDTLVNSIGNIYSVAISNFPYNADLGLYYQYYRVKNGVQYRETYFNFAYTGDEQPLAERRFTSFSGVTDGGTASVTDNVPSTVDERRQPTFRNTDPLGQAMTVTYTVDVRPAYYQIMSGDTLNDIQGTLNISDASEIFTRGVSMNGPATGDWVAWGATLDGTAANKMHDDGTNGDAVAGDSIFTVQFAYEATATIGQEFKFGIDGGDNESGYGLNHIENIDVTAPTVASYWGSINPFKYDAWDYDNNTPMLSLDEITDGLTPNHFALSDNYPNPFNPVTSFSFSLPQSTEVSINIYSVLGKKVATVFNGSAKPGTYKVTWNGKDINGRNLPSGLYIYELDAGIHFKQTKKMTLIK